MFTCDVFVCIRILTDEFLLNIDRNSCKWIYLINFILKIFLFLFLFYISFTFFLLLLLIFYNKNKNKIKIILLLSLPTVFQLVDTNERALVRLCTKISSENLNLHCTLLHVQLNYTIRSHQERFVRKQTSAPWKQKGR